MGVPNEIISDRDPKLAAKVWKKVCTQLNIDHKMSAAHHQQANGQAEAGVKNALKTLEKLFLAKPDHDWIKLLPCVEFAINNTESASTGFSPYYLTFGTHPRMFPDEVSVEQDQTLSWLREIQIAVHEAQLAMLDAQRSQKHYYDRRKRPSPDYEIGMEVLLYGEGYDWPQGTRKPKDLRSYWIGPYPIVEVGKEGTQQFKQVKLGLPKEKNRIHPWVSRDMIKPFLKHDAVKANEEPVRPSPSVKDGHAYYEIETVRDSRIYRKGDKWILSYLLKYRGYPEEDNRWEDFDPKGDTWDQADLDKLKDYDADLFNAALSKGLAQYAVAEQDDWQINPTLARKVFDQMGMPEIDLFADGGNTQAKKFISKKQPGRRKRNCLGSDALSNKWHWGKLGTLLYAFPPPKLVHAVIQKADQDCATLILVTTRPVQIPATLRVKQQLVIVNSRETYIDPDKCPISEFAASQTFFSLIEPVVESRESVKENHKRKPEIPQNDDGADYDKDKTRERGNAEEGDMIGSPN
jgi:hypothetical protein